MNKKISTLLAGAALLSSVSAFALKTGVPVEKLSPDKDGWNKGMYQLVYQKDNTSGQFALVTEKDDKGNISLKLTAIGDADVSNSLWCVQLVKQSQGQAPKYEFLNKGTGVYLDIPYAGTAAIGKGESDTWESALGGEIAGWAFSKTYVDKLETASLFSYIASTDSVIGLRVDDTTTPTKVVYSKLAADKIGSTTEDKFAKFTLMKAGEYPLSAEQVNTILSSQKADAGVKLKFFDDVKGTGITNPFNAQDFFVQQAMNAGAAGAANTEDKGYLYVLTKDSAYLKVDTAYQNATGVKFLAYGWTDLKGDKKKTNATAVDALVKSELNNQYKFQFVYSPSNDSLTIFIKEVRVLTGEGTWKDNATTYEDKTATGGQDDRYKVSLQDLIKDQVRILTAASEQNTIIKFGIENCEPAKNDKTSENNGLYIIKNAEGKVLASPIHKDGKGYEWVTIDEQEAQHMPAFQWLVWKTQKAEKLQATSPLLITNREYEGTATVQLRKDKDGKNIADAFTVAKGTVSFSVAEGSEISFKPIADAEIMKDKYLGYKKFDKDSLIVAKYKFNYLHPFSQSKWIEKGEKTDSVLYAKDGYTAFSISEGKEVQYGAKAGANIAGLADLYRTQYLVTLDADTLGTNAEGKVVLGKLGVQPDSVYFKENNHHNGNHYYAIVNAQNGTINKNKIGVADDGLTANLKSQPLAETRTSAFAIAVDDIPLYRRFNNATLGENDVVDTLRFVEKVRGEYLMDEMNSKLLNKGSGVDYAGIWTSDKSAGLAFHVDAAWVKGGLGFIKPQYLLSVDRHEVAADPGVPCKEEGGHFYFDENNKRVPTDDPYKCAAHGKPGKPGYSIAKYLVSFADSAYKYKDAKEALYTDVKGGYVRVGFVKAIQEGDSLYFLVNGFENRANNDLSVAEVVAAYQKAGIYKDYVKPLTGDEHKNYTWSFRYVTPAADAASVEKEGTVNEFLIESMAYTEKDGKFDATGKKKNIAPNVAAWLKMQNGCLVLTDTNSTFGNAKTGGDGALVFNVKNIDNDELATDNEAISTTDVSVIAGAGQVTIAGAAGKKVVISNILGQAVANTVIASDNAVISAPAGVVVVAVEGEAAVKAIVK